MADELCVGGAPACVQWRSDIDANRDLSERDRMLALLALALAETKEQAA